MTESPTENRSRAVRVSSAIGLLALLVLVGIAVAPLFSHPTTWGSHDWDQMEAHRYLAVKALKSYHQLPAWNPYSCGGHTWWGGVESGTNLVSPLLPVYLLAPLPLALRIEIATMTAVGAIGAWLFVGRLSESPGLRVLAAAVFALNSRWALGVEMGHAWHLYYALVPWALWFFDRALAAPVTAKRNVIGVGVTLAAMVYWGGIYPLPQAIVILMIYAVAASAAFRSWRPIGLLAAGGLLSFAFSAPKLLPIAETLRRFPRLVDSPETIDLNGFVGIFTARSGDPRPAVGPWAWHEFGIYVGWVAFAAMLVAPILAVRWRERAAAFAGVACLVIGLGRFSNVAPWALLHDYVPVFQSQHVPSRWFYPMVLLLLASMAGSVNRLLRRIQSRRWIFEAALIAGALAVGLDVARESAKELTNAFPNEGPTILPSTGPFHQEKVASSTLRYAGADWTAPAVPAMIGNVGLIDCGTFPGLHSYYRDRQGHVPGLGAKGIDEPGYRGEVFLASGTGSATIEQWTPNEVTVKFDGATPGDYVVMNQNWDAGWAAEGGVTNWSDLVAAPASEATGTVHFRYRPKFVYVGLLVLVFAIAGLVVSDRMRRRGGDASG